MTTPNLPYDDSESDMPEWHEAFPMPQTIPAGWNLSEDLSTSRFSVLDYPKSTTED